MEWITVWCQTLTMKIVLNFKKASNILLCIYSCNCCNVHEVTFILDFVAVCLLCIMKLFVYLVRLIVDHVVDTVLSRAILRAAMLLWISTANSAVTQIHVTVPAWRKSPAVFPGDPANEPSALPHLDLRVQDPVQVRSTLSVDISVTSQTLSGSNQKVAHRLSFAG